MERKHFSRLKIQGHTRVHLAENITQGLKTFLLKAAEKQHFILFLWFVLVFVRTKQVSSYEQTLFSECNSGCICSKSEWDPICGENGITYVSACLAGCKTSNGSGKTTVRNFSIIIYDALVCLSLASSVIVIELQFFLK